MTTRQICISIFNEETKEKFTSHSDFLGHDKRVLCMNPGDFVLLYDLDAKNVFGIAILRQLENKKIYRETHPFDQDLYDGKYVKYNKYEIGIEKLFIIDPISIEKIKENCDMDKSEKFMRGHYVSFKRINQKVDKWINKKFIDLLIN
jgi:hypothetical protein